jgi:hypothetical protein
MPPFLALYDPDSEIFQEKVFRQERRLRRLTYATITVVFVDTEELGPVCSRMSRMAV